MKNLEIEGLASGLLMALLFLEKLQRKWEANERNNRKNLKKPLKKTHGKEEENYFLAHTLKIKQKDINQKIMMTHHSRDGSSLL